MCFTVNFAKSFRTPFLIEHLRWLLCQKSLATGVLQKCCSEKFANSATKDTHQPFSFSDAASILTFKCFTDRVTNEVNRNLKRILIFTQQLHNIYKINSDIIIIHRLFNTCAISMRHF